MTTPQKVVLALGIALVITGVIWFLVNKQAPVMLGSSPVGTSFNDAKVSAIAINLANVGANGTSTSILNTDAGDRYVSSVELACEGVGTSKTAYTGTGLAGLQMNVGTTSTAAPATFVSAMPLASAIAFATSTSNFILSSSTLAIATSSNAMVWNANSYMTFNFNATNT